MREPEIAYDDGRVSLIVGDCRDFLDEGDGLLRKSRFDYLVTDPPYGVGKGRWDKYLGGLKEAWSLCDRAALVFWNALDLYNYPLRDDAHFRQVLVWEKPNLPVLHTWDPARFSMSWEPIFYHARTGFKLAQRSDDVFSVNYVANALKTKVHVAQKPELLMMQLLLCLGHAERQSVLDPFAGSGTTLVAAKRLGLRALGIERDPKTAKLAAERLSQGVLWLSDVEEEEPVGWKLRFA